MPKSFPSGTSSTQHDANPDALKGKTIAIAGYGQPRANAA